MILPGLVSVTFRQLSPEEIVDLAVQAGLDGIEWGGDVHAPPGDLNRAKHIQAMTVSAGLQVASYGSYYRVWPCEPAPFDVILETALALQAPIIRVWAGKISSSEATPAYRDQIQQETARIATLAEKAGVRVAFEFHSNTLTDQDTSAIALLSEVNHPSLGCYWQPRVGAGIEENLASLKKISPWLDYVHVFHWKLVHSHSTSAKYERLPLTAGQQAWRQYLAQARAALGDRYALLEFVRGDSPEFFFEDAAALKELCLLSE